MPEEIARPMRPFNRDSCVEVRLQLHPDLDVLGIQVPDHSWKAHSVGEFNDTDRVRSEDLELSRRDVYHRERHKSTSIGQLRPIEI